MRTSVHRLVAVLGPDAGPSTRSTAFLAPIRPARRARPLLRAFATSSSADPAQDPTPGVPTLSCSPTASCSSASPASACAPSAPAALKPIIGLTREELETELQTAGLEKFRAQQIFRWVYQRGATSFDTMTDLGARARRLLADRYSVAPLRPRHESLSSDGTRKWLVEMDPVPGKGEVVETVFIPSVGNPAAFAAALPSPHQAMYPPPLASFLRPPSSSPSSSSSSSSSPTLSAAIAEAAAEGAYDHLDRGSVCISSQIGCSLRCAFCHTGTMPKSQLRNLRPHEVIGQVMLAKRQLGDYAHFGALPLPAGASPPPPPSPPLPPSPSPSPALPSVTNVVLMGMGEPGYNYANVRRAVSVMLDPLGLGLGKRRITLSTSGVVPVIDKLGEDLGVNLAISLHAVRDDIRDVLVPINKSFPLKTLIDACRRYPGAKGSRVVTWEYVMLEGVNDTLADARELARLTHGIPSLVNLIPFNPWPGAQYKCSSMNQIRRFQAAVLEAGAAHLKCSVRTPRGRDILAACGQLAVLKNAQTIDPNLLATGSGGAAQDIPSTL